MSDGKPVESLGTCPVPLRGHRTVQMAHGGGGRAMRDLIERVFRSAFSSGTSVPHDSAIVDLKAGRLAFTTDSFVVSPLFFPGGDIGKLAVFGTVNDLAMAGARPVCLSAGFILEEGFSLGRLRQVVDSMREAADEARVSIVTGDTKVVDRGKGDGLYINTAGIGVVPDGLEVSPSRVRPGDAVLVSGDIGRHGIAVLSIREGLAFETSIQSDCAPLAGLVARLIEAGVEVHCLRDLTRGGLASALGEIALDGGVGIEVEERTIPVEAPVVAACEILGLDPHYVANEGRLVAFVAPADGQHALELMRSHPRAAGAARIGQVVSAHRGVVHLRLSLGGERVLDLLSGEQMPRIC